jgi:prevent-host-death family protein
MFEVDVNRVIPVTDARANISAIVNDALKGNIYVLTKGGKPAVVLAPVGLAKNLLQTTSPSKIKPPKIKSVLKSQNKQIDNKIDESESLDDDGFGMPNLDSTALDEMMNKYAN